MLVILQEPQVVRQAHHEREKANKSNKDTVQPELVEGNFRSFATGSLNQ